MHDSPRSVTITRDDLISTMRDLFAEYSIPEAQIVFAHLGGALNGPGADDGAYGAAAWCQRGGEQWE